MNDDSEPTSPVAPGEVLADKYRIERVLGAGGMGVVVAATELASEQKVAVKFLLPELVRNAEASTRFLREARAVGRIRSEHVARVLDVGKLESKAPYIVMEYLEGRDLSAVLDDAAPLSHETAVRYALEAAEAVAEAHAAGIVHRDLKPANLFLATESGGKDTIKVLDFGIAKLVEESQEAALTQTSAMMGSPHYMSPEQMRSARKADARSDIWALGVVLYELCAGVRPFRGESMAELCSEILAASPEPISEVNSDVPAELDAVIRRCLAKLPADRFQNLAELAEALLPFAPAGADASVERVRGALGAAETKARPAGAPVESNQPSAPARAASVNAEPASAAPGNRGLLIGVAIALVIVAGIWAAMR